MSNSQTQVARLYQDVIDDVIKNMKQEFENEGIDDAVLQELQNLWEVKLQELSKQDDGEEDEGDAEPPTKTENPPFMYPHQPGNAESAAIFVAPARDAAMVDSEQQVADDAAAQMLANPTPSATSQSTKSGETASQKQTDKAAESKPKDEDGSDFSDLGDDLDSEGDDEPETEDIVLCQFEKVTRTKNKWKTTLKDGVMHIGGRDYVFHKGLGEFEW